jgi:hypothetical protein
LLFILCSLQIDFIRCSPIGIKILDDILGFDKAPCKFLSLSLTLHPLQEHFPEAVRYHNLSSKKEMKCPKQARVVVVIGQSNAANHVLSRTYINKKHLNYFNGKCYELKGSMLGATGKGVSIVPAIASKIESTLPYIFITAAWGGTSVLEWGATNSDLSKYVNKNLKQLQNAGHKLHAVIWLQGEDDNIRNTRPEEYILYFNKMKFQILEGLIDNDGVKFIVTQTTFCGMNGVNIKLRNAQKSLANDKNTFVTEGTDNILTNYRFDLCHLNIFGTEAIAKEISSILNSFN